MATTAGGDMYKAILKEIGAEESYMEYLFEESDSEEADDVNGDDNDLIGDFARTDTPRRDTPRGDAKAQQLSVQTLLREVASGDDDNMLTLWQSEGEDSGVDDPNKMKEEENVLSPETYITTSTDASDSPFQEQVPTWKRMLEVANAKQEQIMNQMDSLQKAQRDSSPRNKMRVTVNLRKPSEDPDERSFTPLVLKEINDNDSILNSSMQSSSSTIHQISKRNATLQGQWQSQQEKSNKLQHKLADMQTNFYKTQQQWEKEQQELFSPAKSPSKIPKWRSPTPNDSPAKTSVGNIPDSPYISSENAAAEELELSKALIQQLELQLEESRKVQQSQRDELRDCKDRLKKRDVEHKAFLVQYETEKKAWKDESKEKQAQYQQEIQSRDDDLKDTRQKLQEQMDINQDLREKHQDDSKHLAYIKELEEENNRLKTDYTRKKDLEKTQDEIKSQMKLAFEEQTKKTREFQSRIREIEGKHAEELEYWKGEVEDHRRQIELNSARMENQLEEANARFADLERKHDKEVKEWQLLLDADITRAIGDGSHYEDAESEENMMAIGAGSTDAEALSPIRKEKKSAGNSPNGDSKNKPNESMTMIDDLLHELGQMDVERTAILKEMENNEEPPEQSQNDMDKTNADVSLNSTESEVLDETLHLLNNLKTMLTSQENVNEHETTVIERLEVLSELMQSQEQSRLDSSPAKPRILNSSSSAVDETSAVISALQGNAKNSSFVSAMEASVGSSPWSALVAELRSRCEFLERDRDEVTRITEQILEMERDAHKAELGAAIAEVERKHNEKLHMLQLEANQEMNDFYRNVLFQCEEEAFDYSDGREEIKLN